MRSQFKDSAFAKTVRFCNSLLVTSAQSAKIVRQYKLKVVEKVKKLMSTIIR